MDTILEYYANYCIKNNKGDIRLANVILNMKHKSKEDLIGECKKLGVNSKIFIIYFDLLNKMDHKHSYNSNRGFGMGKTGIRLSSLKPYLGGCPAATKDGMNCNSSLVYTADGKTLDCTEYCRENCRTWVPNMFKRENIPSGAIINVDDRKVNVDIKFTSIMLYTYNEKEDIGTGLELYIYPNGDIKDPNTDEDGGISLTSNKTIEMVCDFILNKFKKGNHNNLTITSYLNKKIMDDKKIRDAYIRAYATGSGLSIKEAKLEIDDDEPWRDNKDFYKFISFRNNLKIFRASKYWIFKTFPGDNIELRIEFQL